MTASAAAKLRDLAQAVLIAVELLRQEAGTLREYAARHVEVAAILEGIEGKLLELATGAEESR